MKKIKRLFQTKPQKQAENHSQNKKKDGKGHFYVTGPNTGFYRPEKAKTREELVEMFKNAS